MINKLLPTMAIALAAVSANAQEVQYNTYGENALDSLGSPIISGTYVLVADLDGDGFDGTAYTAQSTSTDNATATIDADDLILDSGTITDGVVNGSNTLTVSGLPGTYDAGADSYYLLTYDAIFDPINSAPGDAVSYGAELLGTVIDFGFTFDFPVGGNANLLTTTGGPSLVVGDMNLDGNVDGLDIDGFVLALTDLSAYAASVSLSLADATFVGDINVDANVDGLDIDGFVALLTAPVNAVPEPASLALFGLGGLALIRRNRNA